MPRFTQAPCSVLRRFRSLGLAGALLLALAAAPQVQAADATLENAKSQGIVGERADGLLGTVGRNVPQEVKSMVSKVNAERMDRYREIAKRNGSPVEAVQSIAGKKLMDRQRKGAFVNSGNGWEQK